MSRAKIDITKKYKTRSGEAVRLVSDKGNGKFPFIGLTGDDSTPLSWTKEGYWNADITPNYLDLIEVKEPKVLKCWVNFYPGCTTSHSTKEEADEIAGHFTTRIGEAVEVTKEVFE
jgi:hypothetical protein